MTLTDLIAAFFANDRTKEKQYQEWYWQSDVGWLCHDKAGILRWQDGVIEIGIPCVNDNEEYHKYSEHWQECIDAAKLPLQLISMNKIRTVIDTPWGHKNYDHTITWALLAEVLGPPL